MSDRDRSARDRGGELDSRRVSKSGDRGVEQPNRRRDRDETANDSYELPAWDVEQARSNYRPGNDRASREGTRRSERSESDSGSSRNPLPTLGDAFQRPGRQPAEAAGSTPVPRERGSTQRPARSQARPSRASQIDNELDGENAYPETYLDDEAYDAAVPQRDRRSQRRGQTGRLSSAPARPAPTRQIGGIIAAAGPQTRVIALVSGFVVISLVLMAATLLGRLSTIPDWIPIHLNAEGEPDRWGSNDTLWRLPLMACVFTLMCGVVAWYLRNRDAFGARFMVMSSILIHVTSWIALVNFVW